MSNVYRRKLTVCEVERHFVYVESEYRDMFPDANRFFTLFVDSKKIQVKIDNKKRVWAYLLFGAIPSLKAGNAITFQKKGKGEFNVSIDRYI